MIHAELLKLVPSRLKCRAGMYGPQVVLSHGWSMSQFEPWSGSHATAPRRDLEGFICVHDTTRRQGRAPELRPTEISPGSVYRHSGTQRKRRPPTKKAPPKRGCPAVFLARHQPSRLP